MTSQGFDLSLRELIGAYLKGTITAQEFVVKFTVLNNQRGDVIMSLGGFDAREKAAKHHINSLRVFSGLLEDSTWKGVYPGMCINPEDCRGKTHCPRKLSCSE
jgi:hypothetical protein